MAPYVPEEVDVFTVPHSRMKDLVNDYVGLLQTTNFSDFADLKLLLDSLSETFQEFKLHEHIENNLIMKRLKNKLKALSIRNTLVCNCHKDNHLTDMLMLVQEGFGKKNDQDRLNYSRQLKKALEEFTEEFLPHMKQEEEVFQPMLLEYFTYEELCELKRKVIDYHTRKADDIIEKGLIEETEKEESSDSCSEEEEEEDVDVDTCEEKDTRQTSALDLPPEIMTQIFSYLDPGELGTCRQVCTTWSTQALDPQLWTEIHPARWAQGEWKVCIGDVDYDLEDEEAEDEDREEGYTVLDDDADIDESSDNEDDHDHSDYSRKVHRQAVILLGLAKYVLPSVGHAVKVLNLGHCDALTNGMLQRLLKMTPNVEYLNLAGTRISDSGLKGLGKNWCGAHLRHLNLSGCRNITDTVLQRLSQALTGQTENPIIQGRPCWCEQQRRNKSCERQCDTANGAESRQYGANNGQSEDQAMGYRDGVKENCDETNETELYGAETETSSLSTCDIKVPTENPYAELAGDFHGEECGGGDGCHVQCNNGQSFDEEMEREPDPIEDCARPLCPPPVHTLKLLLPPGERTKGAVPPRQEGVLCADQTKTAGCSNSLPFEDDVLGMRDLKPPKLLAYLNMSGCYQITDYGISVLAAVGPLVHLTHLDLSGCLGLTGDGLRPLVAACPGLVHDTLFYCDNIEDGPYPDTASGCQNIACGRRMCCRKAY